MDGSGRTYRFFAAFTAMILLFSGSLPLIQHVCAMARATMHAQPCCCDDAPAHASSKEHTAPAETPCGHEAPVSEALHTVHHLGENCCTTEVAQARKDAGVVTEQLVPSVVLPLLAVSLDLAPAPAAAHAPSFSEASGPPSRPVPLHLLYASFLI